MIVYTIKRLQTVLLMCTEHRSVINENPQMQIKPLTIDN